MLTPLTTKPATQEVSKGWEVMGGTHPDGTRLLHRLPSAFESKAVCFDIFVSLDLLPPHPTPPFILIRHIAIALEESLEQRGGKKDPLCFLILLFQENPKFLAEGAAH